MKTKNLILILALSLLTPSFGQAEEAIPKPSQGALKGVKIKTYANQNNISPQNTQVEGKLFGFLEGAFARRDKLAFEEIYKLYMDSFPSSPRKQELEEFRKSFFYSEEMRTGHLKDTMVRITYPEAKSIKELKDKFRLLKSLGVSKIIMEVSQHDGTPIYLFSQDSNQVGYYFKTDQGPMLNEVLPQVVQIAHDEGLKIHAAFSIRNIPELSQKREYILDDAWNFLSNQTRVTAKLDLFNPKGKELLYNLTHDLIQAKVDGILIKRDFAYLLNEGFSDTAVKLYKLHTGNDINFNRYFTPLHPKNGEFGLLTREEFWDIARWKTKELKQTLWDYVTFIKKTSPDLQLGIEIIPEMVNNPGRAIKHYSTNFKFLQDLEVDYIHLSWRNDKNVDYEEKHTYEKAALEIRKSIPKSRLLVLQIPLNEKNRNVIHFNEELSNFDLLKSENKGLQIGIGKVSRFRNFDFLNLPFKNPTNVKTAKVVDAKVLAIEKSPKDEAKDAPPAIEDKAPPEKEEKKP